MELLPIGYFSKTHGVKGQMVVKASRDFAVEEVKVVFVDLAGDKAPYFITDIKEGNNGIIVGLEGLDAVEKARALIGKQVFIEAALVLEEENDSDWVGFELEDQQLGSLGKIQEVTDNGVQVLVSLRYKDKEVILPMVEAFIQKVDEPGKKIWYNAPEGLIDIYLQPGADNPEDLNV